MRNPNNFSRHDYLYRRIPDTNLNLKDYSIKPSAFSYKEGESVSVFSPLVRTPRDVLQLCIDEQKEYSCSPNPKTRLKGENFLNKNGTTVEQLVEKGWRVAEIRPVLLAEKISRIGKIEFSGHQDLWAKTDDINDFKKFCADKATLLTKEECLSKVVPKEIFFRRNFCFFFVTLISLTKRILGTIISTVEKLGSQKK